MSPTRTVTLAFLGDTAQLNAAMDAAGLKAAAVSDTMGDRLNAASSKTTSADRVGGGWRLKGRSLI